MNDYCIQIKGEALSRLFDNEPICFYTHNRITKHNFYSDTNSLTFLKAIEHEI